MSNQLTRFNRVRYRIFGNTFGNLAISEPRGFQDDEKELLRSKKYLGIMTSLTSSLQFYGRGFQALKQEYDINGIKAVVRIEREDRNDDTDIWELTYSAYFDFSTYQQEKNFISIKLNESQFFKNIEGRIKEKYELERLDDVNGNPIPALEYETLSLEGRDIFRETLFDNDDETIRIRYKGSSTFDALVDLAIPLKLKYRSDDSFFAPSVLIDSGGYLDLFTAQIARGFGGHAVYNSGTVYYLTAENDKTIDINIKLSFRARFASPENGDDATFRIYSDLVEGNPADGYESVDETLLMQCVGASSVPDTPPTYFTIGYNVWKEFTLDYTTSIDLLTGQSLGLRLQPFFSPNPYNRTNIWEFEFTQIELLGQENDLAETTICDALPLFNAFDRVLHIITGKQCFQSNLLLDQNAWRDLLLTNGFKIRKFLDKSITISLEELIDSMMTIDDVALIIENQVVRLELKDYVFDKSGISVSLSQVSDVKRKIIEDLHYSSVEIGYDFDGKYEEVNGLDEFNIKNTYSTCIGNVENVFKAVSKIRADAYGITLAQQKPFENFPKLDTPFDKVNFFIDAKRVGDIYEVRHWEDDFDDAPTGIFSPQTAFNLRLSPFNSILRKGKTISTGLRKYLTERFRYSSTEGNSQLVTLYPERANELNSIFATPFFFPEQIEFEKKLTMAEFRQIVNNPYKLIKFVNEFGDVEEGYIYFSVKPNKEGKFQLVKANI